MNRGEIEVSILEDIPMNAVVFALSCTSLHAFSKENRNVIRLLKGLGVEGDAHCGERVKHRSRVAQDPNQPNLRQVHLIHSELLDELRERGFQVAPGEMGENITTRGISLLNLPTGTKLQLGDSAVIEVQGLRNPCAQLDHFQSGLMAAVLERDERGGLIRRAGIMATVVEGGEIRVGDRILISLPPNPHLPLERV